jgi:hypothetical protein
MHMPNKNISKIYYLLALFPTVVHAQQQTVRSLLGSAGSVLNLFITFLFVLATAVFLWGIVKYVIFLYGEGDPTEAKKYMVWGIIALFLILTFWGIVNIVAYEIFF